MIERQYQLSGYPVFDVIEVSAEPCFLTKSRFLLKIHLDFLIINTLLIGKNTNVAKANSNNNIEVLAASYDQNI